MKKVLKCSLTLALALSCVPMNTSKLDALAASNIEVTNSNNVVTIGNEYIEREFSIADKKLKTASIENKRANTTFTPADGSEEFIIKTTKEQKEAPVVPALNRDGWTAKADSYHNPSGPSDGPAQNLLDGNVDSIWHTNYGGGTGDQEYPHNVVINLNSEQTFQAFSYTPRKQGEETNGNIKGYELWVYNGAVGEDLAIDSTEWKQVAKGDFTYEGVNPIYVNLKEATTATQIKFVATSSNNGAKFAGGAEFNLHAEKAPIEDDNTRSFETSDLTLKENGVKVEDTTATINKTEKIGKKVTFSFEPYNFKGVDYTINEVVVMYEGDHFMRKYMEISVPDEHADEAEIDYIDLESLNVNESDATWTIPTGKGGVVEMDEFKANLGQPIYIQGMFMGCEFPLADTQIVNDNGYIRYYTGKTFNKLVEDKQAASNDGMTNYMTWQTVAGAARSTDNSVIQADFYDYIKSIATPSEFRIQYNSWFDNMMRIDDENILNSFIEVDRELNNTGVRPLDSYVVDDGWNNYNDTHVVDAVRSGTTLNKTGFWEFNSKFPQGLTPSSELVNNFGSNFGVWIGPRGGYNFYSSLADILVKNGTGSKAGNSIDVADRNYIKNFQKMAVNWQKEYKVNYWKWDGFADRAQFNAFSARDGVPGYANNHMTGGYKNMYHVTDMWEAWIDLFEAVRQSEIDDNINNLWISLTCYVNPSPWYLQWANSVWIQCTHDRGDAGPINNKMDTMLTYREAVYYDFIKQHEFQFPLANLYNHDPVYGVEGTQININSMTDEQFKNYLYMMSTRGTSFWELYYSDSIMTKGKYEVNAEFLAWAEENFHILKNAKMFGGNPANGVKLGGIGQSTKFETYGFSAWDGEDGIISMRNPDSKAQTITFTLDRNIGLVESIKDKTLYSTGIHSYNMPEGGNDNYKEFTYGQEVTVTLQPGETRLWSLSTTKDVEAPAYTTLSTDGDKTLNVKFDEKVIGTDFDVTVNGEAVEVTNVNKSVDQVSYEIELASKPANNATVVVTAKNITDLNGNKVAEAQKSVVFHKNNTALSVKADKVTGSKLVGTATKSLNNDNGFSVLVDVNTTVTNKELASQGYTVGVNAEGKAYFTLGNATATSKVVVNDGTDHQIQAVKENNGILKLYVDGKLQSSAYDKDNKTLVIEAAKTTLGSDGFEGKLGIKVLDKALGYNEFTADSGEEGLIPSENINPTATTFDGGEGAVANNANDGNTNTYWASAQTADNRTEKQYLTYELSNTYTVNKVQYIPRFDATQKLNCTGNILEYVVETSIDGQEWKQVATGATVREGNGVTDIVFETPVEAKYVRLSANDTYHWKQGSNNTIVTAAEFKVYGKIELDTIALSQRIEELEKVDTTNCTEESVAEFNALLDEARDVLENATNQEEIAQMIEALKNAEGILKPNEPVVEADKTLLSIAVNVAKAVTEEQLNQVVPVVKKEFTDALQEAELILADSKASQETVNNSFKRLAKAIQMLDFVKGDKTALQTLVDEVKAMESSNYTEESWAKVAEELSKAEALLLDENALQYELDAAKEALQEAVDLLVEVEKVDKTLLQSFYDKVKDTDESKYIASTWPAFIDALSNADSVLKDEKATQEQVDNAYTALVKAYLNLRLIPDKSLLEDLINQANGLNSANYTKATFDGLTKALNEAKAVFANPNATQVEVDNAKAELEKAMANLQTVKAPVNNGDTTSVKTGDSANMLGALAGLMATSFIFFGNKKRKKSK